MEEKEKNDSDMNGSLIHPSTDGVTVLGESNQSISHISAFKRIRLALILFLIPSALYIALPLVTYIPEFVMHILLSFSVVTAVHLLDRWVLFEDTKKYLDKLKEEIKTHVAGQIRSLVRSSTSLTENSLSEIKERVQASLVEQTTSFTSLTENSLSEIKKGVQLSIVEQTASLIKASSSLEAMARSGIVRLYSTRGEACEDIHRDLVAPDNTCIRIIGISLNDFLRGDQKALHEAWKVLEKYIRGERLINNKLDIKVLIIDPGCVGAQLRSSAEVRSQYSVPGRLAEDVNAVARSLVNLEIESNKHENKTGVSFACHLYRLPPMMFLCLTDSVCYVQQYHFWSERVRSTPIPILKYWNHSEMQDEVHDLYLMHKEMMAHFDWIWEKASIPVSDYVNKAMVGIDKGFNQCGAVNVYAHPNEAYKRIKWLLENAKEKVTIQGISLHSFFKNDHLFRAIYRLVESGTADIEVLFLDPNCNQAQYRSYRERLFITPEQTFEQYKQDSRQHKESQLYRETDTSIENIRNMVSDIIRNKKGNQWDSRLVVKLYDTAPNCFMLRVDDTVLVEQYHYGKFIPDDDQEPVPVILGKDMPVIEYSKSAFSIYDDIPFGNPFRLLENHFTFVFRQAKQIVP